MTEGTSRADFMLASDELLASVDRSMFIPFGVDDLMFVSADSWHRADELLEKRRGVRNFTRDGFYSTFRQLVEVSGIDIDADSNEREGELWLLATAEVMFWWGRTGKPLPYTSFTVERTMKKVGDIYDHPELRPYFLAGISDVETAHNLYVNDIDVSLALDLTN